MTDFLPEYKANAVFTGGTGGALVFGEIPSVSLAAQLFPFYKGDKGDKGNAGDKGDAGDASGDLHLAYPQGVASNVWVIAHNLGKRPSVTVQDSALDAVDGDVFYNDLNTLTITFSAALGGVAYLN